MNNNKHIREYLQHWNDNLINEILDQYRAPEDPTVFIRRIGSGGEFSDFGKLVAQNEKDFQGINIYFNQNYISRGIIKSLIMKVSEKEAEDKKNQEISNHYQEQKEILRQELLIAKAFFKVELTDDLISSIRTQYIINLTKGERQKILFNQPENNFNEVSSRKYEKISGYEFELEILNLLIKYGFNNVELTSRLGTNEKYKGDGGIDIVAFDHFNRKVGIQCKNIKLVSNDIISRTYGAKDLSQYKCDYAMVITSGKFTVPARIEARDLNVILWDGENLDDFERQYKDNYLNPKVFYNKKY